jgi:hypothetical protein
VDSAGNPVGGGRPKRTAEEDEKRKEGKAIRKKKKKENTAGEKPRVRGRPQVRRKRTRDGRKAHWEAENGSRVTDDPEKEQSRSADEWKRVTNHNGEKQDLRAQLLLVVSSGEADRVEQLWLMGADVGDKDHLFSAVRGGHFATFLVHLLYCADPSVPDENGSLPLTMAALIGHAGVICAIWDAGGGVEGSPALGHWILTAHDFWSWFFHFSSFFNYDTKTDRKLRDFNRFQKTSLIRKALYVDFPNSHYS